MLPSSTVVSIETGTSFSTSQPELSANQNSPKIYCGTSTKGTWLYRRDRCCCLLLHWSVLSTGKGFQFNHFILFNWNSPFVNLGVVHLMSDYAPNFEKVDGAYWFWVVHASVRQESCMLGFWTFEHILIPHGKIVDTCFFVLVISLSGIMPLWKNQNKIWCMPYEPCMLFEISYMDSSWKNSWPVFFSCSSYLPFWSYAPLKKSEWNLVSKISRKVFETSSADRGWWVDYLSD